MITRILPAIAITTMLAAAPASAAYVNIWSTGFETSEFEMLGPFPYFSLNTNYDGAIFRSAGTAPGLGTQYFSNDTGGTTSFTADGLGSHTSIKLSFDLIFADSWDSINGNPSPDFLNVNVNGTLYQFTAANASGSVDNFGPGTLVATGNYLYSSFTDKIVSYEFIVPHTASTFSLSLSAGGSGFQFGSDESWGIDNFSMSAQAVPEPASWAMLIAGFGLTGAAMRRRRTAIA